jgi:hypothetical protein
MTLLTTLGTDFEFDLRVSTISVGHPQRIASGLWRGKVGHSSILVRREQKWRGGESNPGPRRDSLSNLRV